VDQLRQGWTIVFFGFTQCPDVCPTTLTLLAQTKKQLADLPPAQQPRVLLISVDPERDTPAVLKPYVTFFDPTFNGATGTLEGVQQAATAFGVPYQKMPLPGGGYTMDHGGGVFIVAPDGRLAAYSSAPHVPDVLARDFRKVVQFFEERQR
jgi:protein SCO1